MKIPRWLILSFIILLVLALIAGAIDLFIHILAKNLTT